MPEAPGSGRPSVGGGTVRTRPHWLSVSSPAVAVTPWSHRRLLSPGGVAPPRLPPSLVRMLHLLACRGGPWPMASRAGQGDVRRCVVHSRHGSLGALAQRPRRRRRVPPPVPSLPRRWEGVSVPVPCEPLPVEESRRAHAQTAARACSVDTGSMGTEGSPIQAAQSPKDVNKVMVRIPSQARFPSMVRARHSRSGCPAKPLLWFRDTPGNPTGFVEHRCCWRIHETPLSASEIATRHRQFESMLDHSPTTSTPGTPRPRQRGSHYRTIRQPPVCRTGRSAPHTSLVL